jgi:hypothetical protein
MEDIRIDVGVDTILDIDLTPVTILDGEKVIFTIKNMPSVKSQVIIEKEFTEAKVHKVVITAEESLCIQDKAQYDFQQIMLDGTRIKITENGKVNLRYGVGDKID